jgi:hypothetical protein
VGKRYRMDEGEIEVDSITPIGFPDIRGPSSSTRAEIYFSVLYARELLGRRSAETDANPPFDSRAAAFSRGVIPHDRPPICCVKYGTVTLNLA